MSENDNGLIPLMDLMGQTFSIPHYQRGYRWEDQEVTELLGDLLTFQEDKESGDFYCLQPIVLLKNEEGYYDVLDGQQRLTTLYLILVYLEPTIEQFGRYKYDLFLLKYKTRKKCDKFLFEREFKDKEDRSNIDFFHICKAYQCIKKWFNEHPGAAIELIPILLNKDEKGKRNVKLILYEVFDEKKSIDVFIRLNVGKIPLTDAELTKALLLQSDKYPEKEKELEIIRLKLYNIAVEWDSIETALQDEAFWHFLNDNTNEKNSRIEFIFDLLAGKIYKKKKKEKPQKYATFLIFSEYLKELINKGDDGKNISRIDAVEKIWGEITEYFEYFREWFNNSTLYHYIGLLITLNGCRIIDSLINESKNNSKPEFIEYLEREIAWYVKTAKPLKDLIFEDKNGKAVDIWAIKKILLLHNIYASFKSKNNNARFPFLLYKNNEWSLEHIHARKSRSLTDIKKQKEWLEEHIKSLKNSKAADSEELVIKMESMAGKDEINEEAFKNIEEEVYDKIEKCFEFENDENVHSIKNLCLLDKDTNSQLNNSVFDVKRDKIIRRELEGYYIPICTKNVFLKAYTAFPSSNAYWTKDDRVGYFNNIQETYVYFTGKLKD
jgi:uncharacterized protein with ParB-like and HNH nuclease domain